MKKETKKAPTIRFRGFTDDWDQRKLNEICNKITDGSHFSPPEVDNGYPMPSVKDMTVNGFDYTTCKKISEQDYKILVKQGCKPEKGDVLVAKDGSILKHAFEIKREQNIVILSSIAILRPKHGIIDGKFLAQKLVMDDFKSKVIKENTTGTGVPRIVLSNFKNFSIQFPKFEEQQKIGDYFENLDNLITLHQRKFDQLKTAKKFFLQNMFPAKGEKVPRIRFQGFTGDWEQRKLGEITKLITKGTTPLDKSGRGTVNFIKVENLDLDNGRILSSSKISLEEHNGYLKRSQLQENDILFSIAGTLGRIGVVKSNILPANTNQALAIIRLQEGYLGYVVTALKGSAVTSYILHNPTTGAQPNLSLQQVAELEIPYPSISEQQKISEYFENLDNLITLHQRKLDQLKTLKKFMLQNLFI